MPHCQYCGGLIVERTRRSAKYCGAMCQRIARLARARERYAGARPLLELCREPVVKHQPTSRLYAWEIEVLGALRYAAGRGVTA